MRALLSLLLLALAAAAHLESRALSEIRTNPRNFDWKGHNENCDFLCKRLGGSICGTNFYDCCTPENCKVLYNLRVCVKPIDGYTCNITKRASSLFPELRDQLAPYDK